MNLFTKQKRLTDIENKHGYQRGKLVGAGGRDKLGVWD